MKRFIIILLAIMILVGLGVAATHKVLAESCTAGECISAS